MLQSARPLENSMLHSKLANTSAIRPQAARARRTMAASLMLTSLVDAFSILVIFLILNYSANNEVVNTDKIDLPKASQSQFIQNGTVVRIEPNGQILVEDRKVSTSQLISELKRQFSSAEGAKKEGLVIVADRQMDFADLNPVILAGSQAGFSKFKFAVVQKDR